MARIPKLCWHDLGLQNSGDNVIYLASPYSDPETIIRERRYQAACTATAKLFRAGHTVFSPIVHSHPLVQHGLPTDWRFWERHDVRHLRACDEVVVLMLDGWRESVGVQREIDLAWEYGKVVRFLEQA